MSFRDHPVFGGADEADLPGPGAVIIGLHDRVVRRPPVDPLPPPAVEAPSSGEKTEDAEVLPLRRVR